MQKSLSQLELWEFSIFCKEFDIVIPWEQITKCFKLASVNH